MKPFSQIDFNKSVVQDLRENRDRIHIVFKMALLLYIQIVVIGIIILIKVL